MRILHVLPASLLVSGFAACAYLPPRAVAISAVPPLVHADEALQVIALVDSNYRTGSVRLGGILEDAKGEVVGALSDPGYGSTLTAEVPWATIDAVDPLVFDRGPVAKRKFFATFDENDLHDQFESEPMEVDFVCGSVTDSQRFGVCGTGCVDFDTPDHCGDCGTVCPAGEECRARTCVAVK